MVEEIRKYTFVVYHNDYDDLLGKLRDAGMVHVIRKTEISDCKTAGRDLTLLKRYKKAAGELSLLAPRTLPSEPEGDPEEVLAGLEAKLRQHEEAARNLELLKPEAEKIKPWGDFDAGTIKKLHEAGWEISLFSCNLRNYEPGWEEKYAIREISRYRGLIHFAVIHRSGEAPDIDADPEKLPERTVRNVTVEITSYEQKMIETEAWIKGNAPALLSALNKGTNDTINRIEYFSTAEQAEEYADGTLFILEGWVPLPEIPKVEEVIRSSGCYAIVSEPGEKDKIPVILKNNRFSSLFEPISKLFALPDYRELDLTPFFAPFFMLFFGFCLGDAGYGLFFLAGGFIIKKRIRKEYRPIITLGQYFGVAAIVLGLLSGSFFGLNLIDSGYTVSENSVTVMRERGIPENIIYRLNEIKDQGFRKRESFTAEVTRLIGEDDFSAYRKQILTSTESDLPLVRSIRNYMFSSMNLFYLALMLGGLQIIFGMILKVVNISRLRGFRHSLSTIGWIILVFTIIILKGGPAVELINEEKTRVLFKLMLIVSGIFIFFFNSPDLNIFSRVGIGLWDSYTIVTGVFGDLLSYIRLFALGISSSILGFVFNQMSLQLLSVPYLGWLLFLLLLIFGHSLNIVIATLGSFVHPMRLTFVEFYKNAGFKGGGIEYKPFRIKK